MNRSVGRIVVVAAGLGWAAGASATVYTEDFEGFQSGTRLASVPGWYIADTVSLDPGIFDGCGVAGSAGFSGKNPSNNWTAHTFNWSDPTLTGVVIGLDFQTPPASDANFPFSNDRVAWTTTPLSDSSSSTFGVQLGKNSAAPGGFVITGYYNDGSKTRTDTIATYASPIAGDAWYRVRVAYTKLTAASCRLDVTVQPIDANGVVGVPLVTGTVADTSVLAGTWTHVPPAALFSGSTMCASFKNYADKAYGNADNAYLEIIPEPASILLILGAAGVLVRRPRA
jgi:hypothetical protein